MGLDMSLYVASNDDPYSEEIAYWRKHPNLHGFFEHKWNEAGFDGDMNCVNFTLTEEILDEAIFKVMMNALPPTTGFMFGESRYTPESVDYDINLLTKAKETIQNGHTVIYCADW